MCVTVHRRIDGNAGGFLTGEQTEDAKIKDYVISGESDVISKSVFTPDWHQSDAAFVDWNISPICYHVRIKYVRGISTGDKEHVHFCFVFFLPEKWIFCL